MFTTIRTEKQQRRRWAYTSDKLAPTVSEVILGTTACKQHQLTGRALNHHAITCSEQPHFPHYNIMFISCVNRKILPTVKPSKDVTTTLPPPRIKIPKHRKGEAASSTLRETTSVALGSLQRLQLCICGWLSAVGCQRRASEFKAQCKS